MSDISQVRLYDSTGNMIRLLTIEHTNFHKGDYVEVRNLRYVVKEVIIKILDFEEIEINVHAFETSN